MKTKNKKTNLLSELRSRAIQLAKLVAKERDFYICQKCSRGKGSISIHGSHIIPVSGNGRMAYDPDNIITLCYDCHNNWWHRKVEDAKKWFADKYPNQHRILLQNNIETKKLGPIKREELEYAIEILNDMLK